MTHLAEDLNISSSPASDNSLDQSLRNLAEIAALATGAVAVAVIRETHSGAKAVCFGMPDLDDALAAYALSHPDFSIAEQPDLSVLAHVHNCATPSALAMRILVFRDATGPDKAPSAELLTSLSNGVQRCIQGFYSHERARIQSERARVHNRALVDLSAGLARVTLDLDGTFREIAHAASEALQVSRVGLWTVRQAEPDALYCHTQYDAKAGFTRPGYPIYASKHVEYFETLRRDRYIDAADSCLDPRTSSHSEGYFVPQGIHSTLDFALRSDGALIGVVCFEVTEGHREWTQEEISFGGAIASIAELAIEHDERLKLTQALQRSERRFRALIEQANDLVLLSDENWNVFYASPSLDLLELTPGAATGRRLGDLLHPEAERPGTAEVVYRTPSGRELWVEVSTVNRLDVKGVEGWVTHIRDISQRKLAEQSAQENQRLVRLALKAGGVALFQQDRLHRHTWVYNPQAGFDSRQLIGLTDHELMPAADADRVYAIKQRVMEEGTHAVEEVQIHVGEEERYFRLTLEPIFEGDEVTGLFGAAYEVTEIKSFERALLVSEQRLSSFFNETPAAVAILGLDLSWTRVNQTLARMFGTSVEQFTPEAVPSEIRDVIERNAAEIIRTKSPLADIEVVQRDSYSSWRVSIFPILDSLGEPSGLGFGALDTTTERKAAQALLDINTKLEQYVQERTHELAERNRDLEQFSYAVSHDLRAPLRALAGFSQILHQDYDDVLDEDGKRMTRRIRAGAVRLAKMLDGILDYSRIGTNARETQEVNVPALVLQISEEAGGNSLLVRGQLLIEISPLTILVEKQPLAVALRNLINNAIKFSACREEPRIEVSLTQFPDACEITVCDNGSGFDMAYIDKIFNIFERLDTATEGTGIGLALVSRAAYRLGGRVSATSAPDEGACFVLRFPCAFVKGA